MLRLSTKIVILQKNKLMYQKLKQHFAKHISAPQSELDKFCQLFELAEVKKKDFLLRVGEVCRYETFIIEGLFKVYHIDNKGDEQVLFFAAEDWWVTDFDSFDNRNPSLLYIQALEDSRILQISKDNKEKSYEDFPFLHELFHKMTKKTHISLQRRMIENLSKTAYERYLDYQNRYPHIAQRLSNVQIAGYLGVSHEFVSKIRRKIASK